MCFLTEMVKYEFCFHTCHVSSENFVPRIETGIISSLIFEHFKNVCEKRLYIKCLIFFFYSRIRIMHTIWKYEFNKIISVSISALCESNSRSASVSVHFYSLIRNILHNVPCLRVTAMLRNFRFFFFLCNNIENVSLH